MSAYVAGAIGELIGLAETDGPIDVMGADMPIGLPDAGRRQADVLARQAVGPLRSSVFSIDILSPAKVRFRALAFARLAGEPLIDRKST